MDEDDLKLTCVNVEEVILNKSGKKAIRLDAWAIDNKHRQFSTEMQNDSKTDFLPKRARFYQGLIDTPILKSGYRTKYKNLPSTIIIFITQEDLWKRDRAMYTFCERCVEEPDLVLGDGTKKIFLNMKSKNGKASLISLLQYMKNSNMDNPDIIVRDEKIKKLDEIVSEVKQSEEWEEAKMNILEIGIEKGRQEGIKVLIEDNQEENIPKDRILQKLCRRFDLTTDEAAKYMQMYYTK